MVGAFHGSRYEQAQSEAPNDEGQEYGEARLLDFAL